MGVHHEDRAENASECSISHLKFQNFPGDDTPGPSLRERRPPHAPSLSTARACAAVAVTHTVTPVLGAYILHASSVSETFRRPCLKVERTRSDFGWGSTQTPLGSLQRSPRPSSWREERKDMREGRGKKKERVEEGRGG